MKIKKGDTVKMLSGKDRGKTGKILHVDPKAATVVVEGLNLLTKHQRPRREGEKGQKIQFPRSVSIAKVMALCLKSGKPTRISYKRLQDGRKVRTCKHCQAEW